MTEENTPQVIDAISVPADPRDLLSEDERKELTKYEETVLSQDPRRILAPSTAAKFWNLYLEGYGTKEIHDLNPTFPLGMIIHARVKYNWDLERDNHIKELMGRVKEKVLLTQLESAHYLTDVMSAIHKLNGTKIKKFLQTGDPAELTGLHIETLTNYAKTFELVARLTGQDRDRKVPPPIQINVPAAPAQALPVGTSGVAKVDKMLTPVEASQVVKALLEIHKIREKKE